MEDVASPARPASAPVGLADWLPATGEVCALQLDADEEIVWASPGCRLVFDTEPAALLGRPARELFSPSEALPPQPEGTLELHARRGARVRHVRLFWWREEGGVRVLMIDLERASSAPFAEAAAVTRFGSLVTHELRQPLSSIKLVIQTLARALGGDERGARRLAIAAREVRAMERILNVLSELCRPAPRAAERIDLGALLAQAVRTVAPDFLDRGVALTLAADPALPAVEGDRSRLQLALESLLATCAHAAPPGEVRIEASSQPAGALIAVASGGEPVGQAAGAALSLALIRRVASEHHGSLGAGREGQGGASTLVLRPPGTP